MTLRFLLALLLAVASAGVGASPAKTAPSAALPAWEQLDPAQRQLLVDALRDRWNNAPEQRGRLLDQARRWQAMSPEQKQRARRGLQRFEHMSAEEQLQARALFSRMRTLDKAQREALRTQWRGMSEQQRRQWVRDNPPPAAPLPR